VKRVVFFSGGAASWLAAKRVVEAHGTAGLVLLFTDTRMEDESTYRVVREGAADVGGELVWLAEGRTPWEVFRDVRFLGNTRADPCSRILKREQARSWVEANCDPDDSVLYLGIGWDEEHRCEPIRQHWQPYRVEFPLCAKPYLSKAGMVREMRDAGIEPPSLYADGFPHANCGGFCIKAGQAHFRLLLAAHPERYAHHEAKEEELRELLGDVAILRDRRGGQTKPLPLRTFRKRLEAEGDAECDPFEWGGCGCFSDVEAEAAR
jgi:hypothetical protein